MNLTALVDVAIGLSLMYLGASLFVTIINEYIAQTFELRTRQLRNDLLKLIDSADIQKLLSKNPALQPFFRDTASPLEWLKTVFPLSLLFGTRVERASFVDPNVLAQQLIGGLLASKQGAAGGSAAQNQKVASLQTLAAGSNSRLEAQLAALAQTGAESVDEFVKKVGTYLDRTLVAMGEVYKRKVQLLSLGIGFAIAVAFNLDTLHVGGHLFRDKEARDATVSVAIKFVDSNKDKKDQLEKCLKMSDKDRKAAATGECKEFAGLADAIIGRNATLGKLPIGWGSGGEAFSALVPFWSESEAAKPAAATAGTPTAAAAAPTDAPDRTTLARWAGLLLTALAISLGASFWFDLLTKLVNIRHGMNRPKPDTQPKDATT